MATPGKHRTFAAGLILLIALNVYLYGPLFSPEQRPYNGSIAAGYAGITRFIAEHPDPWGWNPLQYAGQPTQFTYPPLLPYLSAALHWVTGLDPAYSYRVVTSTFACLGAATLAFALYFFTLNPWIALGLGLAYTFCSPLYGLFEKIDADRGLYYLPWRLLVLIKYGEGPHVVGLTLLPLLVVLLRWGAVRGGFPSLFAMAVGLAIGPLTNWLIAFSLTITVLLLILSDWRSAKRLILAGLLGYGLACFWLTPDYIETTLLNWPKDAYGYQVQQSQWRLYGGLAACLALVSYLFHRYGGSFVVRFATLGLVTFLWIAAGFYSFGFDTIPESRRYVLEFEMFGFLAAFAWLHVALQSREGIDKACAVVALFAISVAGMGQVRRSFSRGYSDWGMQETAKTLEYQMAKWLADHRPQGRVFVSGALRFRLNSWFPLHQVSGTFESGLKNRTAADYFYHVRTDADTKPGQEATETQRELAAIGAQYVVVHDQGSQEYYRDIKNPYKFNSIGKVVFKPTPHDFIFEVPFRSFANAVAPDEFPKSQWREDLPRFFAALADSARPYLAAQEITPSHWKITGEVPPGKHISFAMNWDAGWKATQNGAPVTIRRTQIGLMELVPLAAGPVEIDLNFSADGQAKGFAAFSALIWIVSIGLCIRSKRSQGSTLTSSL